MTILERIKKTCREKKNISITTLEEVLGYSNGSLTKAKNMPSNRIVEIAEYLGVSTDYILTGEEKSSSSNVTPDISPARQELLDCVNGLDESQIQKMVEIIESAKKLI